MPLARAPDGSRIAYQVRGTGARALIVIHAWGASGSYFDEAIDNLDLSSSRAITVDLRGHGDSDKPDVELTWDLLARDVFAVADDAGARGFVAVGHSLGGKLSQYLPLVEPERIQALVLVASPSAGTLETPDFVRAWVELAGDGEALVEDAVQRFLRAPVPDEVLQRAARNAAKIPRFYLERTLELVETTSFIERLGGIDVPVLVVSTDDDPVHTTEQDILASFPRARIETMASGVEIPMEQPVEFARVVEKFLAELESD
jgi:pimeloyl-ACP methyl ester carboxylesterase